jgi:hypothetical protein
MLHDNTPVLARDCVASILRLNCKENSGAVRRLYLFQLTLKLESLGFAQNFLSSCELEALHSIGIRSFGEEFREDVIFRGIQEKFRKPLA